jgi:hypothetical protein
MKSFSMLKLPLILLSFSGALLFSPASKAQEGFDHFTGTGVQNVYEPGAGKAAPASVKQMPASVQARKQQTGSASPLQRTAKRGSSLLAQPEAQATADKRKPTPTELKKP